jgi:small-conductance mechanosensitive channel
VRFAANHAISKALGAAGISIPFPQRVVRIETEDTE